MSIDGDHAGWYATALGLLAVAGGLLGLRKKASDDSVHLAKNTAERIEVESSRAELQRLRRELSECKATCAGLVSDNEHLSAELLTAQHYASKYWESLAKRAGTEFQDLDDIPRPPPKRRT